jgi:hypothetical protein
MVASRRQKENNEERPHNSLGYRPPSEFASHYAACMTASVTLQPPLQQRVADRCSSTITQTTLS